MPADVDFSRGFLLLIGTIEDLNMQRKSNVVSLNWMKFTQHTQLQVSSTVLIAGVFLRVARLVEHALSSSPLLCFSFLPPPSYRTSNYICSRDEIFPEYDKKYPTATTVPNRDYTARRFLKKSLVIFVTLSFKPARRMLLIMVSSPVQCYTNVVQ